jgi:hypothetical protein
VELTGGINLGLALGFGEAIGGDGFMGALADIGEWHDGTHQISVASTQFSMLERVWMFTRNSHSSHGSNMDNICARASARSRGIG